MPELHLGTAQQARLNEAMPLSMHLRGSAGYGNELGIPGPSRNLSPLAMGLHSASLSSLPTLSEAITAGGNAATPLVPLGQEGPTPLEPSQMMHSPLQHRLNQGLEVQTARPDSHRHSQSLSHMHTPSSGYAHKYSQSLGAGAAQGHGRALSQPAFGAAVVSEQADEVQLGFAQTEQDPAESLTALAASLADLPLAGSSGSGYHPRTSAGLGHSPADPPGLVYPAASTSVVDHVQQQWPDEHFQVGCLSCYASG